MNLKTVLTVCGSGSAALLASVGILTGASVLPVFADPLLRQTDLVSDVLPAAINDPSLTNAWGISEGPSTPFWISDNGTGITTLYSVPGAGSTAVSKVPLTVTIPSGSLATSAPTGQVFNGTASGFQTWQRFQGGIYLRLRGRHHFGMERGTNAEIEVNNSNSNPSLNAVYKGLAIDNTGGSLFATNFRSGFVEMYKSDGTSQFDLVGSFTDPTVPAGYAPFGAAVIDGKLYVTFALQDSAKHDDVAGLGNGFVDAFNLTGGSMQRLISGGLLDSPWGLALAPSSFGSLAGTFWSAISATGRSTPMIRPRARSRAPLTGSTATRLPSTVCGASRSATTPAAGSPMSCTSPLVPMGESEGLFGSLSVPEPSTWAMMLIGFLGLGLVGYRKTRSAGMASSAA